MLSPEVLQPILVDTNLTFFREVLRFDDAENHQETQNVFQFFSEGIGLDVSWSEPNDKVYISSKMPPFNHSGQSVVLLQPSTSGFSLET